jgi:hypothetical protein
VAATVGFFTQWDPPWALFFDQFTVTMSRRQDQDREVPLGRQAASTNRAACLRCQHASPWAAKLYAEPASVASSI